MSAGQTALSAVRVNGERLASQVTSILAGPSADVIYALETVLADAKSGRIRGISIAVMTGPHDHRFCLAGAYKDHAELAVMAASRLQYKANQLVAARNGEPC